MPVVVISSIAAVVGTVTVLRYRDSIPLFNWSSCTDFRTYHKHNVIVTVYRLRRLVARQSTCDASSTWTVWCGPWARVRRDTSTWRRGGVGRRRRRTRAWRQLDWRSAVWRQNTCSRRVVAVTWDFDAETGQRRRLGSLYRCSLHNGNTTRWARLKLNLCTLKGTGISLDLRQHLRLGLQMDCDTIRLFFLKSDVLHKLEGHSVERITSDKGRYPTAQLMCVFVVLDLDLWPWASTAYSALSCRRRHLCTKFRQNPP